MKNQKWSSFWNNKIIKTIAIFLLALLLIMISTVLFENVEKNKTFLIINIFGTISLIGFLYSYALTKKHMNKDLCIGFTRKEIYNKYINNIFLVCLISILLVIYYLFIFKIIVKINYKELLLLFDFKLIILLPLIFLFLSFLGFLFGLIKMKRRVFYSLFVIICSLILAFLILVELQYLYIIFVLLLVFFLGWLDYIIMTNYKI